MSLSWEEGPKLKVVFKSRNDQCYRLNLYMYLLVMVMFIATVMVTDSLSTCLHLYFEFNWFAKTRTKHKINQVKDEFDVLQHFFSPLQVSWRHCIVNFLRCDIHVEKTWFVTAPLTNPPWEIQLSQCLILEHSYLLNLLRSLSTLLWQQQHSYKKEYKQVSDRWKNNAQLCVISVWTG